jgi:hypothetical protein
MASADTASGDMASDHTTLKNGALAHIGAAALIAVAALSPALAAGPQPVPRNQAPPLHPAPGPCAGYGPGYVRIEGSDTCIKAGATIQTDAYGGSSTTRSGSAIAPALRSQ